MILDSIPEPIRALVPSDFTPDDVINTPISDIITLARCPYSLYVYGAYYGLSFPSTIPCNQLQLVQYIQIKLYPLFADEDGMEFLTKKTYDSAVIKLILYEKEFSYEDILFTTSADRRAMALGIRTVPTKKMKEAKERYIHYINHHHYHIVELVLDIRQPEDLKKYLVGKKVNPLMQWVDKLDTGDPQEFFDAYGVFCPPGADPYAYMVNNISEYRHVDLKLTPDKIDYQLSHGNGQVCRDIDIMRYMNGYCGHRTRSDLLGMYYRHVGFYVPFCNYRGSNQELKVLNQETTFLTPVDSNFYITPEAMPGWNERNFFIGFRTPHGTVVYETEELEGAFYKTPSGASAFRVPNNPTTAFTVDEVSSLYNVLAFWQDCPLRLKIAKIMSENEVSDSTAQAYAAKIMCLEPKDKITKLFELIFYAAMYMRRWRGPGYSYPYTQAETLPKGVDPTYPVSVSMTLVMNAFDEIPQYKQTFVVTRYIHRYAAESRKLYDFLSSIQQGNYCIRMASSVLLECVGFMSDMVGLTLPQFNKRAIVGIM